MKKTKNNVVSGTFGKMKYLDDFLPAPEQLVLKDADSIKVTIVLDQSSVNFFKKKAKELHGSYQRMIRSLLSEYTAKHSQQI